MTGTQAALREATKRWGKTAAVKQEPKCAYIGLHGEFVDAICVKPEDSKNGKPANHYCCHRCSVESGERVYHKAGTQTTAYVVGYIGLGVFFMVQGQGLSYKEAFKDADRKEAWMRERVAVAK